MNQFTKFNLNASFASEMGDVLEHINNSLLDYAVYSSTYKITKNSNVKISQVSSINTFS